MSGWDVMASQSSTAAFVALAVVLMLRVRHAVLATRRRRPVGAVVDVRGSVSDSPIVAAYNDALLAGWPAGELATFGEVASRLATSRDHVRVVVERHRVT